MSSRRSRGGHRARTPNADAATDDGWNVKSSRNRRRNKTKATKSAATGSGGVNRSNAQKQGGNRRPRRRKNKAPKSKLAQTVDAMLRDRSLNKKWDRDDLRRVAEQLKLTRYDPNDQRLKLRVFDALKESALDDVDRCSRSPPALSGDVENESFRQNGADHTFDDKEEEESDYGDRSERDGESRESAESDNDSASRSQSPSDDDGASRESTRSRSDEDDDDDVDDDDEDDDDVDDDDDSRTPTHSESVRSESPYDDDLSDGDRTRSEEKDDAAPSLSEPDGEEMASLSVEPQLPPKRKKRRRRKNKKPTRSALAASAESSAGHRSESMAGDDPPAPLPSASPSAERGQRQRGRTKNRRRRQKTTTLSEKIRALDFSDPATVDLLDQWLSMLRQPQQQQFVNLFVRCKGVEHIVAAVVSQFASISSTGSGSARQPFAERLRSQITELFDVMLCGSSNYHRWLLEQLIALSAQTAKSAQGGRSGSDLDGVSGDSSPSDLRAIVSQQAQALVAAQCVARATANAEQLVMARSDFEKPSAALSAGIADEDPIVPMLVALDSECDALSDLHHKLVEHDALLTRECPTQSEQFGAEYADIRNTLTLNISLNANKQREKEVELDGFQQERERLEEERRHEVRPLEQQLRSHENEKRSLLEQQRRIEGDLRRIREQLDKAEMFRLEMTERIQALDERLKPKVKALETAIYDHQFGMARFAQEQETYSALLKTVEGSYSELEKLGQSQRRSRRDDRNRAEGQYLDRLLNYIGRAAAAKAKVVDRLGDTEQNQDTFRRSEQTAKEHYAQSFDIGAAIAKCSRLIASDEETRDAITEHIDKAMVRAKSMVDARHWTQFVAELRRDRAAEQYLDLSRYDNGHSGHSGGNRGRVQSDGHSLDHQSESKRTARGTATARRGTGGPQPMTMGMASQSANQYRGPLQRRAPQHQHQPQQHRMRQPVQHQPQQQQRRGRQPLQQQRRVAPQQPRPLPHRQPLSAQPMNGHSQSAMGSHSKTQRKPPMTQNKATHHSPLRGQKPPFIRSQQPTQSMQSSNRSQLQQTQQPQTNRPQTQQNQQGVQMAMTMQQQQQQRPQQHPRRAPVISSQPASSHQMNHQYSQYH